MKKKIYTLFLQLLIGHTAALIYAQSTTGSFIGFISDSSGNLVVGAKVIAVNENRGLTRAVVTGKNGEFAITQLPIGRYTLKFEGEGFKQSAAKGLNLELDQKARLNVVMEVGDIKDSLAIYNEGEGTPIIRTETAELGEVIQNKRIVDLPLNGRLFLQLAQLTPGVVENAQGSSAEQLSGYVGPRISVMGARESDNHFSIDGVTATDRFQNTLSIPVSIDAIQEFKVQSKNYSAESGTMGGADKYSYQERNK